MRAALALTGALVLLPPVPTFAQSVQVSGMVSLLGSGRFGTESEPLLGARVIPEFKLAIASGRGVTVDAEVSANAFGTVSFPSDDPTQASGDVKPYRAWLRLSTSRFEARVGLQKVSFGSATIFRPMMWFDSLDPRDPLQLTDGVYALLLRYFTASNASVSGWVMYGNDTRRGWDIVPPDQETAELGGRVQIPLPRGEVAATYHRRRAAIGDVVPSMDPPAAAPSVPVAVSPVPEERFGLDGKWDLGVGFWLEGALVHQKTPLVPRPYQLALNAGLDYTFGVGNGLTAVAEHFRLESSGRALSRGESRSFSALLLRYPLGLLDELSGIFYLDWKTRNVYRFVTWRRTYDALSLNASFFWNPSAILVFAGQPGSSSYAGTGLQLLLSYHF